MNKLKSLLIAERGQSMVEYGLILCLIAMGCMAAVQTFGQNLVQFYGSLPLPI